MEKLEEARESLFFPACGVQAEGVKQSLPRWSMTKASRDTEKKVYIGKTHQQDLLGKDSPGFAYTPKRQRSLPSWGFGTAPARPPLAKPKYPDSSNDLTGKAPDGGEVKHPSKKAVILQSSRDAAYYQPGFDGFPAGACSPGPQRYNPQKSIPGCRLSHAPDIDKISPKYTMRPTYKPPAANSQTPPRVGPGLYPPQEACTAQARSEKPSKPQWSLNKTERFKVQERSDSGRLWDGFGDKARQYNRRYNSAPSFSFGTSTRGHQKKAGNFQTSLDKGPAAQMDRMSAKQPDLPTRHEVMRYSDVPAG